MNWVKEIASVIVILQGLRYTEAKIQKLKAETRQLKAESEVIEGD